MMRTRTMRLLKMNLLQLMDSLVEMMVLAAINLVLILLILRLTIRLAVALILELTSPVRRRFPWKRKHRNSSQQKKLSKPSE